MSRALRRHHSRVAKIRRVRIILCNWFTYDYERPWRELGRLVMNEPGYWVHDWMTVPARRKEKRFERAVERGLDPDGIVWPDNRKPHKYYW